jgi:hypothetical protein
MTITGKEIHPAYTTVALLMILTFFLVSPLYPVVGTIPRVSSALLPVELATVMDISLRDEEAAQRIHS